MFHFPSDIFPYFLLNGLDWIIGGIKKKHKKNQNNSSKKKKHTHTHTKKKTLGKTGLKKQIKYPLSYSSYFQQYFIFDLNVKSSISFSGVLPSFQF